jgi:hypothetical protein
VLAQIILTKLDSEAGEVKVPIFKIRSIELDSGRIRVLHDGLSPGDPFCHLGLHADEGRCILVWYSFVLQAKEQHLLLDLDNSGNFRLCSLWENDREERSVVAEFRKIHQLPGRE